jgi:glyoxylase-like metal-dependent hydrolase (beta-lactamase superfamily II)
MSVFRRSGRPGSIARFKRSPVPDLPVVHRITLPTPWNSDSVQIYLVDSDPLTLIDCGLDDEPSRVALDAALEGLGFGVEDIRRLVLTHYHRDHLGQAERLRDASGSLEVWAHVDEAPMIERFTAERDENVDGMADLLRDFGVPDELVARISENRRRKLATEPVRCRATRVDHLLRDADSIGFKDFALDVIHSPGHTMGHIMLHHEPSRVLISGDQVLFGAAPNAENYYLDGLPDPGDALMRRPRFKGLLEYRRSLRRLRERSFGAILPGFGPVIQRPDRAIQDALLFYEVRIQRIERSLRSVTALGQSVTAYEIWRALFPGEDPIEKMRTHLLTIIGALDVLEAEGLCVTERRDDGAFVHRHAP